MIKVYFRTWYDSTPAPANNGRDWSL